MPREVHRRRPHRVFVSHGAPDTWVARQIAREIQRIGAEPFLDEAEIEAGADFEEDIRTSLEVSDELVVLLTPWAIKRAYVWIELGAAWGRRIPIVALLLGITPAELDLKTGVPVLLKRRSMLQLNEIELYLSQLQKRVKEAAK